MAKDKLHEYSAKRSFAATPEPPAKVHAPAAGPLLFVVQLAWALRQLQGAPLPSRASQPSSDVETIGVKLFTDYAFAFEATSVLILVAMVGAIVLAKKEKG